MIDLLRFRLRRHVCPPLLFFAITGCVGTSARLHASEPGWMLADLDGDHQPDVAQGRALGRTTDGYFYEVQLQLSSDASARSFFFFHNNALGLRITAHDIDGDDDVDLIISDRFFDQDIGVWLNDGRGRFSRSLPGLFASSLPADLAFLPAHPGFRTQRTGVRERRRPGGLAAARYVLPLPLRRSTRQQYPVEWDLRFAVDPLHQRPPPLSFLLIQHHKASEYRDRAVGALHHVRYPAD
jgi:hypothetical protein